MGTELMVVIVLLGIPIVWAGLRQDKRIQGFKAHIAQLEAQLLAARQKEKRVQEAAKAQEQALQVNEALFGWMKDFTVQFHAAEAQVGFLPDMEEFFGDMTPAVREGISIALQPVFVQGTAQLTSQQMEAMSAFQEACQRLLIYLKTVEMEQAALTVGVNGELAIVHQLLNIFREWQPKIDDPAFQVISDALMGKAATRLLNESKLLNGAFDPIALTKLFIAARAERAALDGDPDKPRIEGLPETGAGSFEQALEGVLSHLNGAKASANGANGRLKEYRADG